MNDPPLVSVIVPAYNAARYVAEAIDSIVAQEVAEMEIIVVDDGSTDATPRVLAEYATRPGFTVIRTGNEGVAAARNQGLDRACGRYLAFLDADDRWRPGKLRREIELLESDPEVVAVFCNFVRFNTEGRFLPDQFLFYSELKDLDTRPTAAGSGHRIEGPAFEALVSFSDPPCYTQAMLFRRSSVADLRFRHPPPLHTGRLEYLEDMDYCLRVFRRGSVAFIPEVLVEVRRHGANLSADRRAMPLPKLRSLLQLWEEELSGGERAALKDRLAREWIAAGSYHLSSGKPLRALRSYWRAAVLGRRLSTLKALLLFSMRLGRNG